jgi:hypothetical protein
VAEDANLSVFERRPKLVAFFVVLVLLAIALVIAEVSLRLFGSVNVRYYTGYTKPGIHEYPYGYVPINRAGNPDEEFTLIPGERRVGYFGDSIAYGVGTGYGYRVPDLLQAKLPGMRHWVFAQVGAVLAKEDLTKEIERWQLSSAIYLMNLNDVMPDKSASGASQNARSSLVVRARSGLLGSVDESLRGTSYVYTYLRLGLKNVMQRAGYEAHGDVAYELWPSRYPSVFKQTGDRIIEQAKVVTSRGVRFCVLVLPYEMQVSTDAENQYLSMGFSWEPGFVQGSAQHAITRLLRSANVNVFDLREAFRGQQLRVGQAFVYNKGDKVDWNHPNRVGHALIARWLAGNTEFHANCLPN